MSIRLWRDFLQEGKNSKGCKLEINMVNAPGLYGNTKLYVPDDIPAVGPLSIAIQHDRKPNKVTLEPFGRKVGYPYDQGKIYLIIPCLTFHEIIAVE